MSVTGTEDAPINQSIILLINLPVNVRETCPKMSHVVLITHKVRRWKVQAKSCQGSNEIVQIMKICGDVFEAVESTHSTWLSLAL